MRVIVTSLGSTVSPVDEARAILNVSFVSIVSSPMIVTTKQLVLPFLSLELKLKVRVKGRKSCPAGIQETVVKYSMG